MHLHIYCVLACISLHFAGATNKWEVINDDKPFDDSGTQEQVLSKEELLPFRASKPRPRSRPQQPPKDNAVITMKQAPFSQAKGGNHIIEDEFMPLGVPKHLNRRLLEATAITTIGPSLPPDMNPKKLQFKSDAVNLSTPCKKSDDVKCLYEDVDDYLARQMLNRAVGAAEEEIMNLPGSEEEEEEEDLITRLISRHRRQADPDDDSDNADDSNDDADDSNDDNDDSNDDADDSNDDNDDSNDDDDDSDSDSSEFGSGSDSDTFHQTKNQKSKGAYSTDAAFNFNFPPGTPEPTDKEKEKIRKKLENQLNKELKDSMPGFTFAIVGPPEWNNGTLTYNFTMNINGERAARQANDNDLEEFMLKGAEEAAKRVNNISLPGYPPVTTTLTANKIMEDLHNYCGSQRPCKGIGMEFGGDGGCTNDGFMSGVCAHKCANFPCENNSECELNEKGKPICNCGKRFKGKYCQNKVTKKKKLSKGEKIGIGISSVAAAAALLSCLIYFIACRKNKHIKMTYLEDEANEVARSDPTSIRECVIPRPTFGDRYVSKLYTFQPEELDI